MKKTSAAMAVVMLFSVSCDHPHIRHFQVQDHPVKPSLLRNKWLLEEMAEYVGAYSQTSKPEYEVFVKDGMLYSKIDGESLAVTKLDAQRLAVKPSGAAAPLEVFVTRGKDGRTLYLSRGGRALKKLGVTS